MGLKDSLKSITKKLEKSSFFINFPFSPNSLTLISIFFAILGAYYIHINFILLSIFFIALSLLMDALDGIVARAKKIESKFGAFLDGTTDRIIEFIIILPLFFYNWTNPILMQFLLLIILFFGSFMTSFLVAYSVHREVVKNKDTGKMKIIFARAERTIFLLLVLIFMMFLIDYIAILTTIGAILSIIAFTQRFLFVYKYNKGLI